MAAMSEQSHKPGHFLAGPMAEEANGRSMQRLQFELALDLGSLGRKPAETIREASASVGADLLFVLPAPSGKGLTAVVRLLEEGRHSFLQVTNIGDGFRTADEAQMDAALLALARASVDVFQRLSDDRAIREPLAAAS
jgi:hypothetical protein